MAGSRKKVVVRRSDQSVQAGYLPSSRIVNPASGEVDLLDVAGRLVAARMEDIRYIAYVRDFNLDDTVMPERLTRTVFLARPRTAGLWIRLAFWDGEILEGLAALDISLLDDGAADAGLYLAPPDVRSNTQRLFVPRAAMASLDVLGVITLSPRRPALLPARAKRHPDELALPFPEVRFK